MSKLLQTVLLLAAATQFPLAATAQLVINEIHYRSPGTTENTRVEFVEIHNTSPDFIPVGGAYFSKGIQFTFPEGRTISPNGYLVVAADPAFLLSQSPSLAPSQVLGPWTGSLSNSGETIRLTGADGTTLASAKYATEGDWGTRNRTLSGGVTGWAWQGWADATGFTLERRVASLPGDLGQNWGPSTTTGGTPGAANSIAAAAIAPLIDSVRHDPPVPTQYQAVTISAVLVTPTSSTPTAKVHWRISTASPGSFIEAPMARLGTTDTFQAVLPSNPSLTVIEFYISATDGSLTRTWPAPNNQGQTTNCLYQVETASFVSDTPTYREILSAPELAQFTSMSTGSDAEQNCTFIAEDGTDTVIRYGAGIRYRGASSRDRQPPPNRINLPDDRPWNGTTKLNLNTQYTWLQFIGMKLMTTSGIPGPNTRKMSVKRNGTVLMSNSTVETNYGFWTHVEPLGSEFLSEHFPDNDGGDLYKKVRPDNDWAYRSGNANSYVSDGWVKSSNNSENNWQKLDNLMRVMRQTQGSATYLEQVEAVADLDQWALWFAVETMLTNGETNISNGADDDYSIYFRESDGKAVFVPHDFDTILGQGDSSKLTDPNHTLFDMTERTDDLGPLAPLFGNTAGGGVASFRTKYFNALRQVCLTSFSQTRFDAMLDGLLTGWVPGTKVTEMKTFMNARRTFVLGQCATALGTPTPAAPTPTATGALLMPSKPLQINELLVNNVAAYVTENGAPNYVELKNTTGSEMDISGKRLGKSLSDEDLFTFPEGTLLPANGHIIIATSQGPGDHSALFSLGKNGGSVGLWDKVEAGDTLLDSIAWGPQAVDKAIGRTTDSSFWTLVAPTPAAANGSALPMVGVTSLKINEWLATAQNRLEEEFLELVNLSTLPVNIGGVRLTDDAISTPNAHRFADLSFIAPKDFLVLHSKGDDATPGNGSEITFKLSADHDWITLLGTNGVVVDEAHSLSMRSDISRGRLNDTNGVLGNFTLPTPGQANATPLKNAVDASYALAGKLLQSIRITELMYNPGTAANDQQSEFIELKNIGTEALNLQGLRFTSGIQFEFPSYVLQPGAYAVVVANTEAFEAKYGTGLPVIGQTTSRFSNSGEQVQLQLPAPFEASVQIFSYDNIWYPTTAGGGESLVIRDPRGTLPRWDSPTGWIAGGIANGTPGNIGLPSVYSPLETQATLAVSFGYQILATNDATSYAATGLPTNLNLNTLTGIISGQPSVGGDFDVTLSVTNAIGTTTAVLKIHIELPPAPVITSTLTASAFVTAPFNYIISVINNPTSVTATNLPTWLTYNSSSRQLTGTPTVGGSYTVDISATNSGGTTTAALVINVASSPFISALDGVGLAYTTGGNANWIVQTSVTHDGVDAATNGNIGDSEESWIETQVTGPDQISFWWSTDSESNWDYLLFNVDGITERSISGVVPWTQVTYVIPAGLHTIRWTYRKDGSASTTADAGWLDEVRLLSQTTEPQIISEASATAYQGQPFTFQILATKNPTIYSATGLPLGLNLNTTTGEISGTTNVAAGKVTVTLGVSGATGSSTSVLTLTIGASPETFAGAIEQPLSTFTQSGTEVWIPQTAVSRDGDALQAGPFLSSTQNARFETTVQGPDRISFWWKASNYQYGNYLYFRMDGLYLQAISGEQDWREFVYDVPEGEHVLSWTFTGYQTSSGQNSVWVDNLVIAKLSPVPVFTSAVATVGYLQTPFSFQLAATLDPTAYAATNLPPGLTIDTATGIISGTPTSVGIFQTTVQAVSAAGTGERTLRIEITATDAAILAAIEQPGATLTRTGSPQWSVSTTTSLLGGSSMVTPVLDQVDTSVSTSIQFTTTTADRISFWWRGDYGSGANYMYAQINGKFYSISGTTGWQQIIADVGPGTHTVRFTAYRYGTNVGGQNIGWVDDFRIASLQPVITSPLSTSILLGESINYQSSVSQWANVTWSATGLPNGLTIDAATGKITGLLSAPGSYTLTLRATSGTESVTALITLSIMPNPASLVVGGDAKGVTWQHTLPSENYWYSQSLVTHDGVDALQCGNIGHSQRSQFSVITQGSGELSFWWRASSDSGDRLIIYLDGSWYNSISGNTSWQSYTIDTYNSGVSNFTFSYTRDSGTTSGSNAVWVDEINFTPADYDEDGLADEWEYSHFGNTFTASSPSQDADYDGQSNGAEYIAGTNPLLPESRLRMLPSTALADGSMTLQWASVPGKSYTLQYSTDLNTWSNFPNRVWASGDSTSATVQPLGTSTTSQTLVAVNAQTRARVPNATTSPLWTGGNEVAFAAAGGETGWAGPQAGGVGYERDFVSSSSNTPYTPYFGLNAESIMYNVNTSIYIRIPFTVTNPTLLKSLTLGMRYDDGYAAYINGVLVSSDRMPSPLLYNSEATSSRNDSDAVVMKQMVIDSFLNQVKPGRNILAIHGLNRGITSSDFLIQTQLLASLGVALPRQNKIYWRVVAE